MPGCSYLIARAENVFYILNEAFIPAGLIWTEGIISSALLEKSASVSVNVMNKGEQQIFLLCFQYWVFYSGIHQFLEIDQRKLRLD